MVRFAHMSDVHLGAFRENELRELNILAFEKAVDLCVQKNADFVIIAGDFFDIALPEMGVIDRAVRKMREAQARGIQFYLVYGSHDYSPTGTSVIDVLCSAGVLVKVSSEEQVEGKRRLKVFKDEKTGVSFAGISARARGLEEADFEKIDFSSLESVANPKIFVFHSAITEYTREEFHGIAGGVSINSLPKGFDYYATGHVHLPQVIRDQALQNKPLVYPGPLFASDYRDLEEADFEKIDFSSLESVANPKIFVFHSAITEYTREEFHGIAGGVSINSLPKGFDYYATGHVHLPQVIRDQALQNKPLVYPGPLFASDYRDLEDLSKEKHGFWFCEIEGNECKVERVEVDVCGVIFLNCDANGKSPAAVQGELLDLLQSDLDGKVVLMRVAGTLESGSPKEIDFSGIRDKANSRKARVFYLNRNSLEATEREEVVLSLADAKKMEDELFAKSLDSLSGVSPSLKGASGVSKSKKLLGILKVEPLSGESKSDFESKVVRESKDALSG